MEAGRVRRTITGKVLNPPGFWRMLLIWFMAYAVMMLLIGLIMVR